MSDSKTPNPARVILAKVKIAPRPDFPGRWVAKCYFPNGTNIVPVPAAALDRIKAHPHAAVLDTTEVSASNVDKVDLSAAKLHGCDLTAVDELLAEKALRAAQAARNR